MEKTVNYQLPQWGAGDKIRREDFNAAMGAIDEGMKSAQSTADAAAGAAQGTADTALALASAEKLVLGSFELEGSVLPGVKAGSFPAGAKLALLWSSLASPIVLTVDGGDRMYFGDWAVYRTFVMKDGWFILTYKVDSETRTYQYAVFY